MDGNKNHVPKCFNLCSLKSNHYLIIESELSKNGCKTYILHNPIKIVTSAFHLKLNISYQTHFNKLTIKLDFQMGIRID